MGFTSAWTNSLGNFLIEKHGNIWEQMHVGNIWKRAHTICIWWYRYDTASRPWSVGLKTRFKLVSGRTLTCISAWAACVSPANYWVLPAMESFHLASCSASRSSRSSRLLYTGFYTCAFAEGWALGAGPCWAGFRAKRIWTPLCHPQRQNSTQCLECLKAFLAWVNRLKWMLILCLPSWQGRHMVIGWKRHASRLWSVFQSDTLHGSWPLCVNQRKDSQQNLTAWIRTYYNMSLWCFL